MRVIKWCKVPEPEARRSLAAPPAAPCPTHIPVVEGAANAKESAIALLQLAAEVEHALMVQYLYAAHSLVDGETRASLMKIAVQEMLHLLSVQNVLIALGGPEQVHFGRDKLRTGSELNPLPMELGAATRISVAAYTLAEAPISPPSALAQRLSDLRELVGFEVRHVGAIYATLLWLFHPDDDSCRGSAHEMRALMPAGEHIRPEDFQPADQIDLYSARRTPWRAGSESEHLLSTVKDPLQARALLEKVTEQGEGWGQATRSHFKSFLSILDAIENGEVEVRPLVTNPRGTLDPAPDAGEAYALGGYPKLWADLFDVRYEILLLDMQRALTISTEDERRDTHIRFAFDGMEEIITPIAKHLVGFSVGEGEQRAGPPYALPDHFPPANGMVSTALDDAVARSRGAIAAILAHADHPGDDEGQILVENITFYDEERQS